MIRRALSPRRGSSSPTSPSAGGHLPRSRARRGISGLLFHLAELAVGRDSGFGLVFGERMVSRAVGVALHLRLHRHLPPAPRAAGAVDPLSLGLLLLALPRTHAGHPRLPDRGGRDRLAPGSEGAGRPRGLGPHPSRELSSIRPVHVRSEEHTSEL